MNEISFRDRAIFNTIVLTFFVIGCYAINPPETPTRLGVRYTLVLASDVTDAIRVAAYNAAEDWNTSVNVSIDVVSERDDRIACEKHCYRVAMAPALVFQNGNVGYTLPRKNCDCGVILISLDFEPEVWAQALIAHEIGHMLGLGHLSGETIMNHQVGQGASRVTCQDAAQYYTIRNMEIPACAEVAVGLTER